MTAMPTLDFWFDFASTYSYPAAMRIGPLAAQAGVQARFRPFLLGAIFKARLRTQTEQAERLGIFGAPSFTTTDGELFWGNDRLEQALRWATVARPQAGKER